MAEEMTIIASTDDWFEDCAEVLGWGRNSKGTFFIKIERVSSNGIKYSWTMNVPDMKLGNIPQALDALTPEQRPHLRFRGGWVCGNATATLGLVK